MTLSQLKSGYHTMNSYSALIIDDEPLARVALRNKLEEHLEIEIIGEAGSVEDASAKIPVLQPDLLFLDIQLSDGTGFDLLNKIDFSGKIIFVTAYDEFAIRAFEINALDYLMKPVSDKRLKDAIERLSFDGRIQQPKTEAKLDYNDRLMVMLRRSVNFIKVDTIIAVCASREYSYIHTSDNNEYLTSYNITEWENRLPEHNFCRIHRSTIINFDYILKILPNSTGTADVIMQDNNKSFTISRNCFKKIKDRYSL